MHLFRLSVGVEFDFVDEVRRILKCRRSEQGFDDFPHVDHPVVEAAGNTLANLLVGRILGVVALASVISVAASRR